MISALCRATKRFVRSTAVLGALTTAAVLASCSGDTWHSLTWRDPTGTPTRIVLVGDSLAEEVSPVLAYQHGAMTMVPKYWGGTAPCDWTSVDLEADRRSVVVIQFTGNSLTRCMQDESGQQLAGQAIVDRYARDVSVLVDHARRAGAWVVLVGQPHRAPFFDADGVVDGLNGLYRGLAAQDRFVSFVDAGASVETPERAYTDRLPCESFDRDSGKGGCDADGTVVVRGDGVHFCPVPNTHPCPVWSSGAFRFSSAISKAVDDPGSFDAI